MKNCLDCGATFHGRADKKFCNDQCRNNYNNQLNSQNYALVRTINNILKRNKRILEELAPGGKTRIPRKRLVALNFNFEYFTNIYQTANGHTYYFCYDFGYLALNDGEVLIVHKTAK